MTPLVQRMAKLVPDAGKFMWFDVGNLPFDLEWELDGEYLTHLPFQRTAICGTDAAGVDLALTLFSFGDHVAVSGMAYENKKALMLVTFWFKNENGSIRLLPAPNMELPHKDICLRAVGIIHLLCASLTKVTEAYSPTPTKTFINRQRIKKGKPALDYDWHTVTIEPAAPKTESKGGTHASPRLHDRRGHWRTRNGTRHWVRACVVGDPERGVVEKDYKIGSRGLHQNLT